MSVSDLSTTLIPWAAQKKLQAWIRSRHLVCSGNFFLFETLEYSTVERFEECVTCLGGTLISVEPIKRIWIGDQRPIVLYQAKASLHTPHHDLKQYWFKFGSFQSRFNESL